MIEIFVLAIGVGVGYVLGWIAARDRALAALRQWEQQPQTLRIDLFEQEPPRAGPRLVKR